MKYLLNLSAILFFTTFSYGQIAFNTGNTELDADLNSINASAELNIGSFKAELSTSYDVSTGEIDKLFSLNMEPGEVYLSLELSKLGGKPLDEVADCYKSNKSKGWGYIAKEMGIKPGSPEFHALKGNSKNKKNKGNSGNNGNGNGKGNKGGKKK
jgi:hypothetical protein